MPSRLSSQSSRPTPLRMVIFGVQGSGKGTQAELLAARFGLRHISTGEIFRNEVAKKTTLGRQVARYLAHGPLVPDRVTNVIIAESLQRLAARRRGFILDGYPRNRRQLAFLQRFGPITQAIEIVVPDRVAVGRISGRLNCRCGLSYHAEYNPPKRRGICDRCGRKLFIRVDDRPAAVRRRIRIYHRTTAPLLDFYRRQGTLGQVDGSPPIAIVFSRLMAKLRRAGFNSRRR